MKLSNSRIFVIKRKTNRSKLWVNEEENTMKKSNSDKKKNSLDKKMIR